MEKLQKLQKLQKWLSSADEITINGLYQVIINENLYHLTDVVDRDVINEFIQEFIDLTKCPKCSANINEGLKKMKFDWE